MPLNLEKAVYFDAACHFLGIGRAGLSSCLCLREKEDTSTRKLSRWFQGLCLAGWRGEALLSYDSTDTGKERE